MGEQVIPEPQRTYLPLSSRSCGMAGIADFRLTRRGGLIDRGGSCHTTFSIDNRQSAIGNEYLVFGCGYAVLSYGLNPRPRKREEI